MSGKLKMVLQCVAAGACLFYLSYDEPADDGADLVLVAAGASIWSAVLLTVYSGVVYVVAAVRLLRG